MVDETKNDPTAIWIRKQIESASQEIVDLGVIENKITQSRPIWSIPGKVVLGQLRAADELTSFKWVICGEVRTDHIDSAAAVTPREALRYFSLKWQMDAGRYTDPEAAARLVRQAEELYEMSEADHLWPDTDGSI